MLQPGPEPASRLEGPGVSAIATAGDPAPCAAAVTPGNFHVDPGPAEPCPMHPSALPLAAILRLDTELLLNCVEGVSEDEARRAVAPGTSHVAFLVAHLVESRHLLAAELGAPLPSPLTPYLEGRRGIAEVADLPRLATLVAAWEAVSAHLAVLVERLDTAQLAQPARRLPGSDGTLLGALAFLAQHDAYHVGQLALLRRQLGHPAMSYAMRPREPGRAGA